MPDLWFYEEYANAKVGLPVTNVLTDVKSPFQQVTAYETKEHGKLLVLDGMVMLTERMEFVYHDMIAHVPLFVHPSPKNILIIGGGDGGTAREVLKHSGVESLEMAEIDVMVINTCRKFEFNTATELSNPKLKLIIDDGIAYVGRQENKYDVVIVDGSEPEGPAEALFSIEFYQAIHNALKEDGILVAQSESPFYSQEIFSSFYKTLGKVFPIAMPYLAFIPDYPSGMWSFAFCSKKYHPIDDYKPDSYIASKIYTKYYNGDIHRAAFALPNFVKELLK